MRKLEELLKEYARVFKENFPLFIIPSAPESEIITIIERCLIEKKPFETECNKNIIH